MKIKEKFYPEFFPALFYIIGLFFGVMETSVGDYSGLVWWIASLGLLIYFIFLIWFNYELIGYKNEK